MKEELSYEQMNSKLDKIEQLSRKSELYSFWDLTCIAGLLASLAIGLSF